MGLKRIYRGKPYELSKDPYREEWGAMLQEYKKYFKRQKKMGLI